MDPRPSLVDSDLGFWNPGILHPDILEPTSRSEKNSSPGIPPENRWLWSFAPPRPEE
jgi:hypothetical protein